MSARGRRVEVGTDRRVPGVGDLDPRLVAPAGRRELATVAAEHDTPQGALRCPGCGWVVGGGRRVCPSRALARSVLDRRAVPAWLVHLVDVVAGAVAPESGPGAQARRAAQDALPGLFDAPERVEAHVQRGRR